MPVVFCCGHKGKFKTGVSLAIKSDPVWGRKNLYVGIFCKKCAEFYRKEGLVLETEKEQMAFLKGATSSKSSPQL